ncbi:hypothetical protein HDU92_009160 [Lobulomyces angularis]|nr:hypothetical protein HDU92_009160 [Lobulomyces angularis]
MKTSVRKPEPAFTSNGNFSSKQNLFQQVNKKSQPSVLVKNETDNTLNAFAELRINDLNDKSCMRKSTNVRKDELIQDKIKKPKLWKYFPFSFSYGSSTKSSLGKLKSTKEVGNNRNKTDVSKKDSSSSLVNSTDNICNEKNQTVEVKKTTSTARKSVLASNNKVQPKVDSSRPGSNFSNTTSGALPFSQKKEFPLKSAKNSGPNKSFPGPLNLPPKPSKASKSEAVSAKEAAEKEDLERNGRHSEVVALLNGKKVLSDNFTKKYKLGEVLGDGAFGFVLTAQEIASGTEVAVKFIVKKKIPKELMNKHTNLPIEIQILSKLNHPGIIKFVEYIDELDYILLITEMHGTEWELANKKLNPLNNVGLRTEVRAKAVTSPEAKAECSPLCRLTEAQEKAIRRRTSCDLFECIDAHVQVPEDICKKIMSQIVLAIKYMNENKIVHRDIKDENVVIDENYNVKLVDFGSASLIPESRRDYFQKFNGTAHFASPEIVGGSPYRGPEAEIWALGVLLFTVVCAENPFQTRKEIIKGQYSFPCKVSADCQNLIARMLCANERQRLTIDQVLEHRWLKSEVEKQRKLALMNEKNSSRNLSEKAIILETLKREKEILVNLDVFLTELISKLAEEKSLKNKLINNNNN